MIYGIWFYSVHRLLHRVFNSMLPAAVVALALFFPLLCSSALANERLRTALQGYHALLDLDLTKLSASPTYANDRREAFTQGFDRIAYVLQLQPAGKDARWVCVSLDAFTTDLQKIGLPTRGSGAVFQQTVTGLSVLSNIEGLTLRPDETGHIEFWPHRYGPQNAGKIAGARVDIFDFGDSRGPIEPGFGSMQIHHPTSKRTIFAINNWAAGPKADLGIGNRPSGHPDWTFAANAGEHEVARLRVLVRPNGRPAERNPWVRDFRPGARDVNGEFLGGSEVHHLVGHKGKLYAATGYWMDENNPYYSQGKNKQWAQVLVKDGRDSPWREELDTGDEKGVLRPEILKSVVFRRPDPDVNLLFLATYRTDRENYYVDVQVRNDRTGEWTRTTPYQGRKTRDSHDVSVRSLRVYTDRVTGEERIYLTIGAKGVLSGVLDAKADGWIHWHPFEPVPFTNRALAICEANGALTVGAGDGIWRRTDGPNPTWTEIQHFRDLVDRPVDPAIGGIRGMTTIRNPNGPGHSLILFWTNADAVGARGSIYRFDPDGRGGYTRHEDVRLAPVVQRELNATPTFFLGAYSYFRPLRNPVTGETEHLVGLYLHLKPGGHDYPAWSKKGIYSGGLYAIRNARGEYRIHEVNRRHDGVDTPLTAVRAITPSPFPGDTDVYFGGHDCANIMSTDYAWVYRAPLREVLLLPKK